MTADRINAINAHDIDHMSALRMAVSEALGEHSPYNAEITVYDQHTGSYLLGTLFWDSETEGWRWDVSPYGKESL